MLKLSRLLPLYSVLLALQITHAASFTPIGTVASFPHSYYPFVSADGTTVVGSLSKVISNDPIQSNDLAFRWTAANGLSTIPVGESWSRVAGVSADGSVVVGNHGLLDIGSEIRASHAWRWTVGAGPQRLSDSLFESKAVDVSNDGNTVLVNKFGPSGRDRAHVWRAGGQQQIIEPPSENLNTYARAISANGTAVGGVAGPPNSNQAGNPFRWNSESGIQVVDLSTRGFSDSDVSGLSGDGNMVLGVGVNIFESGDPELGSWPVPTPFIWKANDEIQFLRLPAANERNFFLPLGLSDDGHRIVGAWTTNGWSSLQAAYWDPDGPHLLSDLLSAHSILPPDWTLEFISSVSADGRFAAGNGINPDGNYEAFLVELPLPVPEPTSLVLLGITLLLAGLWFFRLRRARGLGGLAI